MIKDTAYSKIESLKKKILYLENFGKEECIENYLLTYSNRTIEQAKNSIIFKKLERQIKDMKLELEKFELFIDMWNHLEFQVNTQEREDLSITEIIVS